MAIEKQIKQVMFESSHFINGNGSTAQQYIINIQDMGINITPEFYTGSAFDTAISGRLRQNLRGLRINIELSYQRSSQPEIIKMLINNIIRAFATNNADSIIFYPVASQINNFDVVLDAATYNQQYNNTVNSFAPSISLVSLDEILIIPEYLEAP